MSPLDPKTEARKLHKEIWKKRYQLWPEGVPSDPVRLLDPQKAAELLGYSYKVLPSLPVLLPRRHGPIAGMVNTARKLVAVSLEWGDEHMRFTGAHEIGHIVLHGRDQLFRDGPIDSPRSSQNRVERDADRFAAEFLMPEKLVKSRFEQAYNTVLLRINDDIAFHLDPNDHQNLLRPETGSIDCEMALAKCGRNFSGDHIIPLHKQFKASVRAMAIRIQELKLVAK